MDILILFPIVCALDIACMVAAVFSWLLWWRASGEMPTDPRYLFSLFANRRSYVYFWVLVSSISVGLLANNYALGLVPAYEKAIKVKREATTEGTVLNLHTTSLHGELQRAVPS